MTTYYVVGKANDKTIANYVSQISHRDWYVVIDKDTGIVRKLPYDAIFKYPFEPNYKPKPDFVVLFKTDAGWSSSAVAKDVGWFYSASTEIVGSKIGVTFTIRTSADSLYSVSYYTKTLFDNSVTHVFTKYSALSAKHETDDIFIDSPINLCEGLKSVSKLIDKYFNRAGVLSLDAEDSTKLISYYLGSKLSQLSADVLDSVPVSFTVHEDGYITFWFKQYNDMLLFSNSSNMLFTLIKDYAVVTAMNSKFFYCPYFYILLDDCVFPYNDGAFLVDDINITFGRETNHFYIQGAESRSINSKKPKIKIRGNLDNLKDTHIFYEVSDVSYEPWK